MGTNLRRTEARRGNTMIETSMVLTVCIAVLTGIADIGKVMFLHQGLMERARAGARYAAVSAYDSGKIANIVVYNQETPDQSGHPVFYNLETAHVAVSLLDSGTVNARVEVKIQNYPYNLVMPFVAGAYTAKPVIASVTHEQSLP